MILKDVYAEAFFTLRKAALDTPTGLTVFVGKNGAGKTALGLEAPAWCLWGQTIRGTVPDTAAVTITTQGHKVLRTRIKKKTELAFEGGGKDLSGQTPTETQRRIDAVFGSFEQFCSTRVFSSRLLTRFGGATDKDRKALLEEILGLGRFELAAGLARKVLATEKASLATAESLVQAGEASLVQAQAAETALKASPGRPGAVVGAELARATQKASEAHGAWEKLKAMHADALAAHKKALDASAGFGTAYNEAHAQVSSLAKILAGEACSLCKRPFPSTHDHGKVQEDLGAAKKVAEGYYVSWENSKRACDPLRVKVEFIARKIDTLAATVNDARGDVRGLTAELKGSAARDHLIDEAAARVDAVSEALAVSMTDVRKYVMAVLLASEACAVLGPKGVRSRLLEGALAELQIAVNELLPRMGGHAKSLSISGTKTRVSGEEVAEVSISVEGAGGGDYKGLSDGERVRVDVALLLGLAKLSRDQGLLVLDEVFDPLDDEGLEGAAEVLAEMARDRQVFLITHNPRFLGLMPSARVVRVERGADGFSQIAT